MADRDRIREFRSNVARLKKAGLINRLVDARRAVPSRSLNSAIRKFQDVLKGNAAVLPISRTGLTESEARRRGLQISRPIGESRKVVVRHFPGEKVSVSGHAIRFSSPEGIRRIELPPVRTDTAGHFFSDLKKNKVKLPDKRKGERFGARYFTSRTQLYDSFHELLNAINLYDSTLEAHGRKQTEELLRNIEIFSIDKNPETEARWDAAKRTDRQILIARNKARRKQHREREKAKRTMWGVFDSVKGNKRVGRKFVSFSAARKDADARNERYRRKTINAGPFVTRYFVDEIR